MAQFWYDQQIRRYLLQFVRIFNGFQVQSGQKNAGGTSSQVYKTVPMRYADMSRMVAHVLRGNTENALNSTPFMTCNVANLNVARERRHDPKLISSQQIQERKYDSMNDQYTAELGNTYTVDRYMPVPYDLTINVDVWCSNTEQKLQLLEQILTLFNPTVEIQSNTNPLDWTNIYELELIDINWTSRAIPAGVDEQLDIATLNFAVPIWLSPPAKVKRQSIIQQIVADIHETSSIENLGFNEGYHDFFKDIADTAEVVVTPNNYYVQITGATAILLDNAGITKKWADIIEMQGELSSTSKLKLNISNDTDSDANMVTGKIAALPGNDTTLVFTLDNDTLPSNTLTAVDKIIDARANYPGDGTLAAAVIGQRYLITEDISATGHPNWAVNAESNDIIQYDGTKWSVVFDASATSDNYYVTNTNTSKQYRWHENSWISSYEGIYNPGYWRLSL